MSNQMTSMGKSDLTSSWLKTQKSSANQNVRRSITYLDMDAELNESEPHVLQDMEERDPDEPQTRLVGRDGGTWNGSYHKRGY